MSKIIAVWGSPNSGKTTCAVKLSAAIYERYNASVLMLSCDNVTPSLPTIFPNFKSDDLFSVGVPLSKTDITQQELIKSIVTLKSKINLGFLGYKDGENKFTYPDYDKKKARTFIEVLKSLADFVVVDCTSTLDNSLSCFCVKEADEVIRLATPTLKSISFFASQLPLYADPAFNLDRQIVGLNCTENDCFMPIDEVKNHLKNVSFTLPYCREIRQQTMDGELVKSVSDKKYAAKFKAIADKVVRNNA
ncbi:MAG: hypothetical protein RR239_05220 [Oscillospiraceae bacterium]